MPMTITIKYARLPHGLVYYYQLWAPENPKALVVFLHGLGDHIGRYGKFVQAMIGQGFACALYDQRGHGRSQGRRGHVRRFSDWMSDLATFIPFAQASVPPETPLFLVGMSLGGLIGINSLLTHASPIDGMVALSAAVVPTVQIPTWKQRLGQRLAPLLPTMSIDNGIRIEDLTRDAAEQEALEQDPHFHRRITLGAGIEIERNLELVMAMPHRIHIPMLMLAGDDDRICDPEGTRRFAARLSSTDRRCTIYPEMAHDLLHDVGSERVQDDIGRWIAEHAASRPAPERQYLLHRRETLWEDVSSPLP